VPAVVARLTDKSNYTGVMKTIAQERAGSATRKSVTSPTIAMGDTLTRKCVPPRLRSCAVSLSLSRARALTVAWDRTNASPTSPTAKSKGQQKPSCVPSADALGCLWSSVPSVVHDFVR
jgi:hypothetical protein